MDYPTLITKENESLILTCIVSNGEDTVLPLNSMEITSKIRRLSGELTTSMLVEITEASLGKFQCKLDNEELPANTYLVDMVFKDTLRDVQIASSTFKLKIEKGITK